jgi:hypothetical protein
MSAATGQNELPYPVLTSGAPHSPTAIAWSTR